MTSVCFFVNRQTTNICLHDKQMIKSWRKIVWTSVLPYSVWCLHVSMPLFLHASMPPWLNVSMHPCLYVNVSTSPCLHIWIHLHVFMSPCPCFHVSGIPKTNNGTNGKRKRHTSVCLLQTEMENGSLLFLARKLYTVINACCFSKHAHLWFLIFIPLPMLHSAKWRNLIYQLQIPTRIFGLTKNKWNFFAKEYWQSFAKCVEGKNFASL